MITYILDFFEVDRYLPIEIKWKLIKSYDVLCRLLVHTVNLLPDLFGIDGCLVP